MLKKKQSILSQQNQGAVVSEVCTRDFPSQNKRWEALHHQHSSNTDVTHYIRQPQSSPFSFMLLCVGPSNWQAAVSLAQTGIITTVAITNPEQLSGLVVQNKNLKTSYIIMIGLYDNIMLFCSLMLTQQRNF